MQNFKITPATVCYYIAGKCFSSFNADSALLKIVEKSAREFLFDSTACAEKEGGIIGSYRISSDLYPVMQVRTKEGVLVGEVDGRKAEAEKPYLCIYLPERKKADNAERAFLFSSNEEDLNLLKELAFPFAGD